MAGTKHGRGKEECDIASSTREPDSRTITKSGNRKILQHNRHS